MDANEKREWRFGLFASIPKFAILGDPDENADVIITPTGEVRFGPDANIYGAAKQFWEFVVQYSPLAKEILFLRDEIDEVRSIRKEKKFQEIPLQFNLQIDSMKKEIEFLRGQLDFIRQIATAGKCCWCGNTVEILQNDLRYSLWVHMDSCEQSPAHIINERMSYAMEESAKELVRVSIALAGIKDGEYYARRVRHVAETLKSISIVPISEFRI